MSSTSESGVAMTSPTLESGSVVAESETYRQPEQFDDRQQEYAASKLGMWIFLATEILLFGGLFCVYAAYRSSHPEIFRFGGEFLDVGWGAINTLVLLLSSFTMAMAVRAAQVSDRGRLKLYLAMTLFLGADFLGIKWIEYRHKFHEHIFPGGYFAWGAPPAMPAADPTTVPAADPGAFVPGDAEKGRKLYFSNCAVCHGISGENGGVPGITLPRSKFVRERDDEALVRFVESGRPPNDPLNTTGQYMLPKGGNPRLTREDLCHIVGYVRVLQARASGSGGGAASATRVVATVDENGSRRLPTEVENRSPDAAKRPTNLQIFFSVYFGMTGLHGIHVIVGMVVIAWLLKRAIVGDFGGQYFFPVEMGGLYWHLVDLIWIYLFPLLYLVN
jgi:cytochrome c oxidase subunit III